DFGPDARAQDNVIYLDNLTFAEGTPKADVNVTFQVDMNVQITKGNFDPATEVVAVVGGMNNWLNDDEATNAEKAMADDDADGIYTKTIAMQPNSSYDYKYNIGTAWDGRDELVGQPNRNVAVGDTDLIIDVVFFNNEAATGIPSTVTFNVDMQGPEGTGAFDRTQNNVFVAGSFTDWQNDPIIMTDEDGDSVFTVTVDSLTSGETLFFKFTWAPGDTMGAPGTTWEDDPNRELFVLDGENEYLDYWNRIDPTTTLADGNITFNVDMSVMTEVGVFDADNDQMQVRGGFNGWGDNDPSIAHMNQDFLDPNQWFLQVPFVQAPVGADQLFKYYVAIDSASDPNKFEMWTDGWERPFMFGGGNRPAAFEGTPDQFLDPEYYDGVLPNYVILEDGIEITFSIDMTVAADANQQVPTFMPGTDTVWWVGEQPAFVYSQGWEDTDHMKVLALTDDDGDMVYEGTLTVQAPSWNGFEYRYGFSNGGDLTLEEAGFGSFAYRVRYIEQNGYRSFVQPYAAPTDTWQLQENKQSEWEEGPAGDVTGVEDLGVIANKFSLKQNYPNPFNPTTQISFSIPSTDVVTLKIYDVLGQEVKTLLNEEMSAGTYEFTFNASNLSSGLYFYTLKSGDYVSTLKMMLLK
ncbi:MAG: T9SS type A sorting domain-containing protein, partial [Melioribacteraceae bacterium]|nr:T9SS type A sorting domain-containing protein [Melioribacteraceae bacterium]